MASCATTRYDAAGLIVGSETRNALSAVDRIHDDRTHRRDESASPPGTLRDDDAARLDRGAVLARRRREALRPGQARLRLPLAARAIPRTTPTTSSATRSAPRVAGATPTTASTTGCSRRDPSATATTRRASRPREAASRSPGPRRAASRRYGACLRDMGPLGPPRRARIRRASHGASTSSAAGSRATPRSGSDRRARPRRGLARAALGGPDLPPLRLPRERQLRQDAVGEVTNHYRYGPYGVERSYGQRGEHATPSSASPRPGPSCCSARRVYDPVDRAVPVAGSACSR